MKDENNQEMYKSVEEYAENQELWIDDFLRAWSKMQSNGYSNLRDGPTGFWSHKCCFYREIAFNGNDLEEFKIDDAIECQEKCRQNNKCKWFGFTSRNKTCKLKSAMPSEGTYELKKAHVDDFAGPAYCPIGENFCDAYKAL